jgi:hypothetical protein
MGQAVQCVVNEAPCRQTEREWQHGVKWARSSRHPEKVFGMLPVWANPIIRIEQTPDMSLTVQFDKTRKAGQVDRYSSDKVAAAPPDRGAKMGKRFGQVNSAKGLQSA